MTDLDKAREALESATKYPLGGGYFVLDKEREEILSALTNHERDMKKLIEAAKKVDLNGSGYLQLRLALRPFMGEKSA